MGAVVLRDGSVSVLIERIAQAVRIEALTADGLVAWMLAEDEAAALVRVLVA